MQDTPKKTNPKLSKPLPFLGRKTDGKVKVPHRILPRAGRYLPWFVAAFIGSCVIGGVTAYIAKNNTPAPPPVIALSLQDIEKIVEVKVAPPPPPPPLIKVDSYAPANHRALSNWSQMPGAYGYMDTISIGGDDPGPLTSRPLNNDDVLTLTGWAGHQRLGMTMEHVVLAMCGQLVGSVTVNGPRPDVAKAVHPYLDKSGWYAQLAVAHLPRCDDAKLMAFSLAFKGASLWPLNQNFAVTLPPGDEAKAGQFASRASIHDPNMRVTPEARTITVRASALRVRSCGGAECSVLGRVSKGVYKGYVVERRNGWTLIQLPTMAGWLSEKHIRLGS